MNKLQNNLVSYKKNLSRPTDYHFRLFKQIFVGHPTDHIVSDRPGRWTEKKNPPSDQRILDHLNKKIWGGSRYLEDTRFSTLDFDHNSLKDVLRTRSIIGATPANSMLCTSVRPGRFHMHLPLSINDPLVLISFLQSVFKPLTRRGLFECYPQAKQGIRWPFGKDQIPLDKGCRNLVRWEDQLDYFCNLEIYPLDGPFYDQLELNLGPDTPGAHHHSHVTPVSIDLPSRTKPHRKIFRPGDEEALDLIRNELPGPSTRDNSQFILFNYQFRHGMSLDESKLFVSEFIRDHNKGYSKDYRRSPDFVMKHISGQAERVDNFYKKRGILPADIYCSEHEFLTETYISFALDHCDHKWPVFKLNAKIIAYFSSRKHRELVRIPSKLLKKWSGKDFYIKHINTFLTHDAGKRGSGYSPKYYSKYLMLNLPDSNEDDAIHFNGRLAKTGEEAITALYTPAEARQLLKDKGFQKRNANIIIQRIYDRGGNKSGTHYTSGAGAR